MAGHRPWIWYQLMFGFATVRAHEMLEQEPQPKVLYEKLHGRELARDRLTTTEWEHWEQAWERAGQIEEQTLQKKCSMITPDMPEYPPLLQQIYSKPFVLYAKGTIPQWEPSIVVTVAGARRSTEYGEVVCDFFVEGLALQGVTLVSGLAFGIDSCAAQRMVDLQGTVCGVQACGLDYDYPKGNSPLKTAICERGVVWTEYPMGVKPSRHTFQPRNRIMAGMSHGVLILEAGDHSGALNTAEYGLEYGREVYAAPGNIFSGTFAGSHALIREGGAKLVTTPNDLFEDFSQFDKNWQAASGTIKTPKSVEVCLPEGLDTMVYQLYDILSDQKQSPDDCARQLQVPIAEVLVALTTLEILSLAKSHPGGYVTLP